jgi:hypothetical protein
MEQRQTDYRKHADSKGGIIEIIRTKNDAPIYLAQLNIPRAITRGYR